MAGEAKKKSVRPEMSWHEGRQKWRKRIVISGRSHDVYGITKEEVRRKVRELERQAEAGLVVNDGTTLLDYAEKWFAAKEPGLKFGTSKMYRYVVNVHISPFFKNIALRDIRPLNVQMFMAAKACLSKSMQTKLLITMKQIMGSAVENGLILKDPCHGIKAGGARALPKVPLTREQQAELCGAVAGTRAELFTLLCLYAGLRREEALGLMWQNVYLDTDAPYIDVRHTVTFEDGRPNHSDDLKSKAAYRSIPIPLPLSEALAAARKTANSLLVVPAAGTDGAMSLTAFRWMWGAVVGYKRPTGKVDENGKRIKRFVPGAVAFPVTPHLLRHTYITELCASGLFDIKKIQYLAGHEDVAMTLRIYTHVVNNSPRELSGNIVKMFPGSAPGSEGEKESLSH